MAENRFAAMDGVTLTELEFSARKFCVKGLIPQGLCILGGAPKVGKSWLVLEWCIRIAKGEPVWEMPTTQGTTLYLCLEDTYQRIQQRVFCITDELPQNIYFANAAGTLEEGLEEQILTFVREHKDTVLIVIDTFQIVRGNGKDPSYGGDYADLQKLKRIADSQQIAILLVHHLRKQGDRDPINRLSGTTGISGAVDGAFVLDRKDRSQNAALLICTGRDMDYRELELKFSKERFVWELISDSLEKPESLLTPELISFLEYMKTVEYFSGGNTELADRFKEYCCTEVEPKRLKQLMNRFRDSLQELGLTFRSHRSNGQRLVEVRYTEPVTQVPEVTQKTGP